MFQFSLGELKEIEEAVSGDLKLKIQQAIKREENGVITTSEIFIPFSQALAIEVRRYEDGIIDTEIIHSILPCFYEKNYGNIYLNLEKALEKSKKEINGDVTVTASYDTTAEVLADILNRYEKGGACIKEIIETKKGNFRIIYTVENEGEFGI